MLGCQFRWLGAVGFHLWISQQILCDSRKVSGGSFSGSLVEFEDPECAVAEVAEESSDSSCRVVVVNGKVAFPRNLAADSAASTLRCQNLLILACVKTVGSLDISVMVFFLLDSGEFAFRLRTRRATRRVRLWLRCPRHAKACSAHSQWPRRAHRFRLSVRTL